MTTINASQVPVKPRIADIVAAIKPGQTVIFNAARDGSFNTARCAIYRANNRLEKDEYKLSTSDNGATYEITRIS